MCTVMIVDNNQMTRNWVQECIHESSIQLNKIILCQTDVEAEKYISNNDVDIALARIDHQDQDCVKLIQSIKKNLLFSIVLGYGNCKDSNSLRTVFNNGVSRYLKDIFDKSEFDCTLLDAYEQYCANKIKLHSITENVKNGSDTSYNQTFIRLWVESYLRNAKYNLNEAIDAYIEMLMSVMDNQQLLQSKTMILEMLIVISDKVNKGLVKTDYVLFNSKDCSAIMNFKSAEDLQEMVRNYLINLAKNIYLLSNDNKNKIMPIISAISYIKKNYYKDISRDDVACAVSLNPCYFSKFFKEQSGESFVSYLRRIRMEKAKELLENAGESVSVVSEKVGYADRKYFSKLFYDYTGFTPCEYRKNIKKLLA